MKQIEITTTTHPMALAIYTAQMFSGVINLVDVPNPLPLPVGAFGAWAMVTALSGALALNGALLAPFRKYAVIAPLHLEMIGCILIAITRVIFLGVYIAARGVTFSETFILIATLVVGSTWRAIQIHRQVRTIRSVEVASVDPSRARGGN